MFGFGDYKAKCWQYQKIHKHNDEDFDKTVSQNGGHAFDGTGMISNVGRNSSRMRTSHRTADFYRPLVLVLVGINVLLSVALLWVVIAVAERTPHQPDTGVQRAGQAEIPVEMELYRFRTGVREKTPFFGAPNASTDAAWSTILNGEPSTCRNGPCYSHFFISRVGQAHARASRQIECTNSQKPARSDILRWNSRGISSTTLSGKLWLQT
jgi:hypothetical protein